MNALQMNIEGRKKEVGVLADINDFSYSSTRKIEPNLIIRNARISLYCFDDEKRNAVFVELPEDIDLSTVPFVYHTQFEYAKRLIVVPYDIFVKLAQNLPDVINPIFIYMAGRSGSTLLSHIFNASNVVESLSEPDVATQLAHLRHDAGIRDISEIEILAKSAIRYLFRTYQAGGIQAHALKFRSEGIRAADLMQKVFPNAKNLFLYRDTISWISSFYKLIKNNYHIPEYMSVIEWIKRNETIKCASFSHLTAFLRKDCKKLSIPEQLALWLIAIIEWYIEQFENGIPILAIRYQDLDKHREEVLKSIFTYCGIPVDCLSSALRAFSKDSQSGSHLSNGNTRSFNRVQLNKEQVHSVLRILNQHTVLSNVDFSLPGTLQVKL